MRSISDALHPARRWILFLASAEFVALFLAFEAAVLVRFFGDFDLIDQAFGGSKVLRGLVFAGVLMLAMTSMGLYATHSRDGWSGHVVRALVAFFAGGLTLMALQYLTPVDDIGRGVMVLALGFGFAGVMVARAFALRVGQGELLRRQVLVLGVGEKADLIHSRLRRDSDRRTFGIVGYVPVQGDAERVPAELRLSPSEGLPAMVDLLGVDEIVVAPDCRRGSLPLDELMACRLRGVHVNDLHTFLENQTGRAHINALSPSWIVFDAGFDRSVVRSASKRVFDIASSSLLLLLALPLMVLTAVLIKLESPGPVLYRQVRTGLHGRSFSIAKFRSMRNDAEKDGKPVWAAANDARVTRVGAVIRRLRIDELPQLFNVLLGEMSLVGPRPERPYFVEQLTQEIPFYALRHSVKPGVTGWAQVRYPYGATVEDSQEKLQYDLYYIKNRSMALNLYIIFETLKTVITRSGS